MWKPTRSAPSSPSSSVAGVLLLFMERNDNAIEHGEMTPGMASGLLGVLAFSFSFPATRLALGGLELAGRYGDFTGRPLGDDDVQQIVVARARARHARGERRG